jgi:hypothetical protein
MSKIGLASLASASWLLAGAISVARPPDNADPLLAPWFQSLQQPGTGMSCCSIADCRPTDYRTSGNHFEAWVDYRWIPIPPERVLQRTDNPVGRAIVCWRPSIGVMCFVRAAET